MNIVDSCRCLQAWVLVPTYEYCRVLQVSAGVSFGAHLWILSSLAGVCRREFWMPTYEYCLFLQVSAWWVLNAHLWILSILAGVCRLTSGESCLQLTIKQSRWVVYFPGLVFSFLSAADLYFKVSKSFWKQNVFFLFRIRLGVLFRIISWYPCSCSAGCLGSSR